jgi:hypothetical protein
MSVSETAIPIGRLRHCANAISNGVLHNDSRWQPPQEVRNMMINFEYAGECESEDMRRQASNDT